MPVTPRGAASGQAAGAVALGGGIVVALNAMNRVLEIDVANMQVICEPGRRPRPPEHRAGATRPGLPADPWLEPHGDRRRMASTNAHGMRAVKYGPTSAWVLGLEVVLPDGQIIETGSVGSRAKQSSAGLELTKLIVGAEGVLGVVTRLRLKLMAIPPARAIVLGLFDALEHAGQAVQAVFAAGVSPSAIEILDQRCIQAMNLFRPTMDLASGGTDALRSRRQRTRCAMGRRAGERDRRSICAEVGVVGRAGADQRIVGGPLGGGRGGRDAAAGLQSCVLWRGHLRAGGSHSRDAACDSGHQCAPPHSDRDVRAHRWRRLAPRAT